MDDYWDDKLITGREDDMKTDVFGTITFRCEYPNSETITMSASGETNADELREIFQRFMLAMGYHPDCVKGEPDED